MATFAITFREDENWSELNFKTRAEADAHFVQEYLSGRSLVRMTRHEEHKGKEAVEVARCVRVDRRRR